MYNEQDFSILSRMIRETIPETCRIILFGSYAKDSAVKESDIDILILTTDELERHRRLELLTKLRWQTAKAGYKTDFMLKSLTEFEESLSKPTMAKAIHEEGMLLWKTS